MKLYEIVREIEECAEILEQSGGELTAEMEHRLDKLHLSFAQKVENIAKLILNYEAAIDSISSEIKRLREKRESFEARLQWLRDYLARCVGIGRKYQVGAMTLSWRRSEAVEVIDADAVPDAYCKVEMVRTPAKDEIKRSLKEGAAIPGVVLVERHNLQIR